MKKLLYLSIVLFFLNCTKKEALKNEQHNATESEQKIAADTEKDKQTLFDLLSKWEDKSQFFNVSSSKPSVVKGKKGTIIHLVPNNLELENGDKISGEIQVELKELTNQMDLARNNTQTISDGKLLISGGSYYINITSNGKKVNLKKGKTLEVGFPKITNRKMELFYGTRDSSNQMNWKVGQAKLASQISTEKVIVDTKSETVDIISGDIDAILAYTENGEDNIPKKDIAKIKKIENTNYKNINLKQLGWINCDAFYNQTTENLSITFEEEKELTFVKSYIIFKDINSVLNMDTFKNSNLKSEVKLPINQKITMISFSYKDEKIYAGKIEYFTTKKGNIQISLKEVTEKEMERLFKI